GVHQARHQLPQGAPRRARGPRAGSRTGLGHGLGPHTDAAAGRKRERDGRSERPTERSLMRPTIVLVHGAFAESSSWDQAIDQLLDAGYPVTAIANPLRGVAADAACVSDHVRSIEGPVVLVGHSYGGAVITNVDPEAGEIVGLVYVAAFAPLPGDSCFELSAVFPGSTLGDALRAVSRSDGTTTDLLIVRERFHEQFAADVPAPRAARMAATQRPVTQEALVEPSGERS